MSLEEEGPCFETGSLRRNYGGGNQDKLTFRIKGLQIDEIAEEILKRDTAVRSDGTLEKDEKVMVVKKKQTGLNMAESEQI